ncbi:hypothetical protein Zmor_014332 [Zophobas morio]|uniref:Uncharacterized protein n=1 Tax=Zophobas morio TaxID=2755281 RepID=A0AA38IFS3_9CUCU|nr:hypothetical protein Zmor_014332 [Zophobas morio]
MSTIPEAKEKREFISPAPEDAIYESMRNVESKNTINTVATRKTIIYTWITIVGCICVHGVSFLLLTKQKQNINNINAREEKKGLCSESNARPQVRVPTEHNGQHYS